MHDPLREFREALAAFGLGTPEIIADGLLHRFRAPDDKPGSKNAWYVLHLDRPAAGAFGSWRTGDSATWCERPDGRLDPEERLRLEATIAQGRAAQEEERHQRQAAAAQRAAGIWAAATPADPGHPYLVRKGIGPHGIRQTGAGLLLVPVRAGERLLSLQTITPAGEKRFLPGGQVAGAYYRVPGTLSAPLVIGEGFATVASLVEATGAPGIVAFFAGNLAPVAKAMRRDHPDLEIIVAGDNDAATPGNPGATQATAAARAIAAKVLIPSFEGLERHGTDWNDWLALTRRRHPAASLAGGHHG